MMRSPHKPGSRVMRIDGVQIETVHDPSRPSSLRETMLPIDAVIQYIGPPHTIKPRP
jgi:hypothetical protein